MGEEFIDVMGVIAKAGVDADSVLLLLALPCGWDAPTFVVLPWTVELFELTTICCCG